jgi:hypothetical protein
LETKVGGFEQEIAEITEGENAELRPPLTHGIKSGIEFNAAANWVIDRDR